MYEKLFCTHPLLKKNILFYHNMMNGTMLDQDINMNINGFHKHGMQKPEICSEKSYKIFSSAAVVCNNGICATAGKNILAEGGSVVDAAIASMLCLGVVSFQSAGIGGGFYMIYYDAETGKDYFIDARSVAPLGVNPDIYINDYVARYGRSSIGVPGEIRGYWEAHRRFGKLPWSRLFDPAIELAENGFQMTFSCDKWLKITMKKVHENLYLRKFLKHPNGEFKQKGDIFHRPVFAETLRTIAREGAEAYYDGSLTQSILQDIHDGFGLPSAITKDDLKQYKVRIRESIKIDLGNDLTMIAPGAPSGGPILAFILKVLKGYNFTAEDLKEDKILTFHRIIETIKFAYCKRNKMGDPDFNDEIVQIINEMMSDKFCENVREKIDDFQTHSSEYYGDVEVRVPNDQGTAHLGIVGPDGSAVAITSTVNQPFGSNILGKRTGIVFNDQMVDFSRPHATANGIQECNNLIEPVKRGLSSTTPTIIIDKSAPQCSKVKMVIGGAGGTHIINATALTIMQSLWFNKTLDEAVRSKRFHHGWIPNVLLIQEGTDQEIIQGLLKRGHEVEEVDSHLSSVQAILRINEKTIAAKCDDRRGGSPDGY
uniref:glutathione hydrolase 1 proenzyme-like isoform X2 n=1 Tax=Styela clava TaxID=7725 RepID=UPI001939C372|nr:glutathione hydrolase 1 proenzyme-like isoform X2 [Styela clava]